MTTATTHRQAADTPWTATRRTDGGITLSDGHTEWLIFPDQAQAIEALFDHELWEQSCAEHVPFDDPFAWSDESPEVGF